MANSGPQKILAGVLVAALLCVPAALAAAPRTAGNIDAGAALPSDTGAADAVSNRGRAPLRLAQAQPQQQGENFPAGPGGAASQSGIISGRGHLKTQHGDWSELCQAESGPGSERCILVQNIESANRPGFGLATVVRKIPSEQGDTTMMHIYAPLGIYLPKGLGLQVDDQLIGNTPFWSCIPFQCEARVTLPPDLLNKLKSGERALFAVYENPTKGTVLPISLRGFTDGVQALTPFIPDGAPPENQSEAQ